MYAAPVVASVIKAELQLTSFVGLISHGLDQIPRDAADSTYISQEMVVEICEAGQQQNQQILYAPANPQQFDPENQPSDWLGERHPLTSNPAMPSGRKCGEKASWPMNHPPALATEIASTCLKRSWWHDCWGYLIYRWILYRDNISECCLGIYIYNYIIYIILNKLWRMMWLRIWDGSVKVVQTILALHAFALTWLCTDRPQIENHLSQVAEEPGFFSTLLPRCLR